jgi:hypothetical protein
VGETLLKQIADGYDGNAPKYQLRLSILCPRNQRNKRGKERKKKTKPNNPGTKALDLNLAVSPLKGLGQIHQVSHPGFTSRSKALLHLDFGL